MGKQHVYRATIKWTGNLGTGTSDYTAYSRDHEISGVDGKPIIEGSADSIYRGDKSRYNPEELMLAAVAGCHMLWYLHLCADAGIIITDYEDAPIGVLIESADGNGRFSEATIYPKVTLQTGSNDVQALALHQKAHEFCFIANSLNFPIHVKPEIILRKS